VSHTGCSHRQIAPEAEAGREVQAFMEHALFHTGIAEEDNGHAVTALHDECQGGADPERDRGANDSRRAHHACGFVG